jgi:hypothetical protein
MDAASRKGRVSRDRIVSVETGRARRRGAAAVPRAVSCVLLVLGVAVGTVACAKPKAKIIPDVPMEIPPAPPRDIETTELPSTPPVGLMTEPARAVPERPRPTGQVRTEPREAPRPEPPPQSRPDDLRRGTALQTTPVEREGEVEQKLRALVAKASRDLAKVDYRLLDRDARTQYDTAKRFIDQAEDAVRDRNFVLAGTLADKAATLANQLGGR